MRHHMLVIKGKTSCYSLWIIGIFPITGRFTRKPEPASLWGKPAHSAGRELSAISSFAGSRCPPPLLGPPFLPANGPAAESGAEGTARCAPPPGTPPRHCGAPWRARRGAATLGRRMGRATAGSARRSRRGSAAAGSPAGGNRRGRGKAAGGPPAQPPGPGAFDLGAQSGRWAAFQERHRLSCEEAARLLLDA